MAYSTSKIYPSWARTFIEEPRELTPGKRQSIPYLTLILGFFCIAGAAVQACLLLSHISSLWVILPTAAWSLGGIFVLLFRPRVFSLVIVVLLSPICGSQAILLQRMLVTSAGSLPISLTAASFGLSLMGLITILNAPLRDPRLSRSSISRPYSKPSNELRSPEDNLTMWQWMTVSWISPLLSVGNTRQLQDGDVWLLPYEFQHGYLHEAFRHLQGSVVRRLIRANWMDLAILTVLACVELAANYSAPMILQKLLKSMEGLQISKKPALTYAILSLFVRFVAAQSGVFSLWYQRRCYERSRGEMITMLYEKTLNRKVVANLKEKDPASDASAATSDTDSTKAPDENTPLLLGKSDPPQNSEPRSPLWKFTASVKTFWSTVSAWGRIEADKKSKEPAAMGKILNLMKNDVYEVAQRFWEFQNIFTKPLGLVVALVLIIRLLGTTALLGVAVVVVAQVVNFGLSKVLIQWSKVRRMATDKRLQQTSQYIEAIRHLRWYGWQNTWLDKVMDARKAELNLKILINLLTTALHLTNTLTGGLVPIAAFWAYTVLAGQELRVDIAFPALDLFMMLQSALAEIPQLITVWLNALVAIDRIEDFMKEPNKEEQANFDTGAEPDSIVLKTASFAWPGRTEDVLHDVDVTITHGLNVIFGEVAAGKTALLQAILGELDLTHGELKKPHKPIAYCAQSPWLQSMTIRNNILFNSEYNAERYQQVIEACALGPDFANFPEGDLSPIGENGIGLSGGQKARVALARALYSQASIILLDDPLSALDQQTAEHIAQRGLRGSLVSDRSIVLVTHRIDLCQSIADQMIEVSEGRVTPIARSADGRHAKLERVVSAVLADADDSNGSSDPANNGAKFEDEEHRAHGGVKSAVYWEYFKAGKPQGWVLIVVFSVLFRLVNLAQAWYLKEWGEAYNRPGVKTTLIAFGSRLHSVVAPDSGPRNFLDDLLHGIFERFPNPALSVDPWLKGFLIIVLVMSVALMLAQLSTQYVTYMASRQMFKDVMISVSRTTFRFYDVTPVGRLMNRLTSDIGVIDDGISMLFLLIAWYTISWLSSILVIATATPLFLAVSLLLTVAFVLIFLRFLPTSQNLRRLEMASLSPLMSNFGALLNGLTTVRAFRAEPQFQEKIIEVTDTFQKMDHFYWSVQAWLMYRFDTLSACSTFILTLVAIYSDVSAGLTAFVLINAGKFVEATHVLCRQYGQLQLNFVSVERVVELKHLKAERSSDVDPPAWWPSFGGDIVFQNVTLRYAPHLDPALRNVSFTLKGGSTTAIVGRTGSGKSTLASAVLATVLADEGQILVDGVDIADVNKQALRSRITFLAQEPILFEGTIRHNLDPVQEQSDAECNSVLARVCGKYGWTLDTMVEAGGKNLSQGQRQLVGLARAILRRSSIIIMDEATASIDLDTAWEIQRVLREEMQGSTVITIAHRTSAVRDADYALVLSHGRVAAQGRPEEVNLPDIEES